MQGEPFGPAIDDDEVEQAVSPVKKKPRNGEPPSSSTLPSASTSAATTNTEAPSPQNRSTLTREELNEAIARHQNVCPISIITPYYNAWAIRGLVACKSALKTYNNRNGPGKLFSFNLIDDSGEIRITAFNKEADKFFHIVKEGEPVYVSRGNVKPANKKYSNVNHEYELTMNEATIVEPCNSEELANGGTSVPKIRYNFKPLAEIESEPVDAVVDLVGVLRSVGDVESFVSKRTSREIVKRDLLLVDSSLAEVKVTLFGEKAVALSSATPGAVLALRGAKVGDFGGGRNVATTYSSLITLSPDIPEATLLQSWYATEGQSATFNPLGRENSSAGGSGPNSRSEHQQFICQISPTLVESITSSGTGGPAYFNVTGLVANTNNPENHLYRSCPGDGGRCSKKVEPSPTDDRYQCLKCGHSGTGDWKWRLLVSLRIDDATGPLWVTVFQENAEKLLGKSAAELARLRFSGSGGGGGESAETTTCAYRRLLNETVKLKEFTLRVGVRIEEWNGERRTRAVAYSIKPVEAEPAKRSRQLLAAIEAMAAQL